MNRLHHLEKTLMQNLQNNIDYSGLEILLLNYNSGDGMEEWAQKNLGSYMDAGTISYYKTTEPTEFSHSHSKNLAFKLAKGDIVCNINADNYIGQGFAYYINEVFQSHENVFMAPDPGAEMDGGVAGIVCVKRSDFFKVGGFDERMKIYGWEDVDLTHRLERSGLTKIKISDREMIRAIPHSEDEKYDKNKIQREIHAIYANCANPAVESAVTLFILYRDGTFRRGTVINNVLRAEEDAAFKEEFKQRTFFRFMYELKDRHWTTGNWNATGNAIELTGITFGNPAVIYHQSADNVICRETAGDDATLYKIVHEELFYRIAFNVVEYDNRIIMLDNFYDKITTVSQETFGQATVYKNFSNDTGMIVR